MDYGGMSDRVALARTIAFEQFKQLGDVRRDPPRFILSQHLRHTSVSLLTLA